MSTSRRTFLQRASALGLLYSSSRAFPQMKMSHAGPMVVAASQGGGMGKPNRVVDAPMLHTLELKPFVEPLPLPEIAKPVHRNGRATYTVTMQEIHAKVHPDVAPTRMWSYGTTPLAPLIVARKGEPISIDWVNHLPTKHFLPIDYSLHGCGHNLPEVRAVTHLHGAKTRSVDDGYPEDWYVPGKSRVSHYPMEQDATMLWYHDHAMGLNRLNIYAGLFGMLLIRDEVENALRLPSGKYELPLILYDRDFTADGQLMYGTSGDPKHPWISEFTADGLLINGKVNPYFEAEPQVYRLRLLNVANSRFFNLRLSDGKPLIQIGSDQGLLGAPVAKRVISLAPAERADVLLDLSPYAGQKIYLQTGLQSILEFRVASKAAGDASVYSVPRMLRKIERTPESEAVVTRRIMLHDYIDAFEKSSMMLIDGKHWHAPVTERPRLNSTEIWEFVNLTEDTHPMHLHMVRFQVLDRQGLNTDIYFLEKGKMQYIGKQAPPDENEMGWKDVVQCPPGSITRIIVKFEGYTGKYLYHCHILEHESNDMMRPFEVIA